MELEPNRMFPVLKDWGLKDLDDKLITEPRAIAIFFSMLTNQTTVTADEGFYLYGTTVTDKHTEDARYVISEKVLGVRVLSDGIIKITTARMTDFLVSVSSIDTAWQQAIYEATQTDAKVKKLGIEVQKVIKFPTIATRKHTGTYN